MDDSAWQFKMRDFILEQTNVAKSVVSEKASKTLMATRSRHWISMEAYTGHDHQWRTVNGEE